MGAEGIVDTKQALFRRLRSPEVDTAGRDTCGQGARAGHGRDRAERRESALEGVREVHGQPDSGPGRKSEQLVRKGALVRPTAVAGGWSGLQHRRNADAPATTARRKLHELVGERCQTRAETHTGDQFGRSGRDKRGDRRAARYRL